MRALSPFTLLLFLCLLCFPSALHAQEPFVDGEAERLEAPPLPENPTQLDSGAYEYAQRCMACHGDRGQGLTEEWRAAWGEEEMNCWQSKCHAANHPPEGFKLPHYAPQVIGERALLRFETAQELYDFMSEQMPWHAPGSLEEQTYWQLTAFLLHRNDVGLNEQLLAPQNAPSIRLREMPYQPPPPLPPSQCACRSPWLISAWMGGILLVAGGAFVIVLRRQDVF
jgi:hypothetical protein